MDISAATHMFAALSQETRLHAFRLLVEAGERLAPGGWLIFEFGYGQDSAVQALAARDPNLSPVRICEDLQGVPRTAVLRREP